MLRSADPAGLEQELWALLALYQALRRAMVTAIETVPGTEPDRASFATALQTAIQTLIQADGILATSTSPVGRIGHAVLNDLLPPRRPASVPARSNPPYPAGTTPTRAGPPAAPLSPA